MIISIVIPVWEIAFKELRSIFRTSKHYNYTISWNKEYLLSVLNRRLEVYSDNRICDWTEIFENDFGSVDEIIRLANSNPRDMWDILDQIFVAQYEIEKGAKKLSKEAVKNGMNNFVSTFSFYEYYPRKRKARKNTNDVYSYIKHLLTLKDTDEFTNEELNNSANTGGSTTNYITNMMKIGLVEKTEKKRPGGAVVYRIIDPKVSYAIKNDLVIGQ